jgi:hypothetical protein
MPLFFTALTKLKNNFCASDSAALVAITPVFAPPLNKSNMLINPVASPPAIPPPIPIFFNVVLFLGSSGPSAKDNLPPLANCILQNLKEFLVFVVALVLVLFQKVFEILHIQLIVIVDKVENLQFSILEVFLYFPHTEVR